MAESMVPRFVSTPPPVPKLVSRAPAERRQRSSSTSSAGRKRLAARCSRETVRLRSHEKNHMMHLLSGAGLRKDENASAAGARTERRGGAGPVRDLLGGRTSPAALLTSYLLNLPGGPRGLPRRRVGL